MVDNGAGYVSVYDLITGSGGLWYRRNSLQKVIHCNASACRPDPLSQRKVTLGCVRLVPAKKTQDERC